MTTDTGMVDRLALICARHADTFQSGDVSPSLNTHPSDYSPHEWLTAQACVRAVLECLRTPTPEMVEAGMTVMDNRCNEPASGVVPDAFIAMIDRALSPSKGDGE